MPNGLDRVDLGPTWFWPAFQPQLDRLVHELGLERFAQHEEGDLVVRIFVREDRLENLPKIASR